jgi:hypothetical protein
MPIPPAGHADLTASAVVMELFRQLHNELRDLIEQCGQEALNFVPCAGANSIATIVTHLTGSEAETMRCVAGVECVRDRDAEFRRGEQTASSLLAQVDAADVLLDELAPEITAERLACQFPLPTRPRSEARSGIAWIIGNLGHAREHIGHAWLTKQLYDA